jgi:diaminohydroxyphosphoribosylaminopyrimidine deaminase/5-amino-6-(5-phosphoribosylamino)uracil reductase
VEPALLRHIRTHDPAEVLAALNAEGIRHVLVEGGASVLGAFLRAGLVDEVHAYVAPLFLGAGRLAVPDLGIGTLAEAPRWTLGTVLALGESVWLQLTSPTRGVHRTNPDPPLLRPEGATMFASNPTTSRLHPLNPDPTPATP